MIHIKRDGRWLCKQEWATYRSQVGTAMKMSEAHRISNLNESVHICQNCKKQYYAWLDRQPNLVVVDNEDCRNF